MTLYAFTLGREYKLSLAELGHIFGFENLREHSESIALFELREKLDPSILQHIGGTIRIIEIIGESDERRFPTDVISHIQSRVQGSEARKPDFALGAYGLEYRLSDIGLRIKKTLQESGLHTRLINTKNENINAATWKKERLGKSKTEYNLIKIGESLSYGITIACQDVDAYARRDTSKSRDMVVGMMPPKLVQMMINLTYQNTTHSHHEVRSFLGISIYDPFCGLGTTLIEAANMGITTLYGSDISREMVEATQSSLDAFIREEKVWQERIKAVGGTPKKDFSKLKSGVWQMDARKVDTATKHISEKDVTIVSEGYLGEIMTPRDISLDRVRSERRQLAQMYSDFFRGLTRANFCNSIVMSFPFWNIHGTYSYFTEIYDILDDAGWSVVPLLPSEMKLNTMKGSLLYRRENQTVGREIIKLIPKK